MGDASGFRKKRQALLDVCTSLSTQHGAKVLVRVHIGSFPLNPLTAPRQCVMTTHADKGWKQNLVTTDPVTGEICANKLDGESVIFNSYHESGCNIISKGAKVSFRLKVSRPDCVSAENTAKRKHEAITVKKEMPEPVKTQILEAADEEVVDLTSLDSLYSEIAMQREKCALLLRDDPPPRAMSVADVSKIGARQVAIA